MTAIARQKTELAASAKAAKIGGPLARATFALKLLGMLGTQTSIRVVSQPANFHVAVFRVERIGLGTPRLPGVSIAIGAGHGSVSTFATTCDATVAYGGHVTLPVPFTAFLGSAGFSLSASTKNTLGFAFVELASTQPPGIQLFREKYTALPRLTQRLVESRRRAGSPTIECDEKNGSKYAYGLSLSDYGPLHAAAGKEHSTS